MEPTFSYLEDTQVFSCLGDLFVLTLATYDSISLHFSGDEVDIRILRKGNFFVKCTAVNE